MGRKNVKSTKKSNRRSKITGASADTTSDTTPSTGRAAVLDKMKSPLRKEYGRIKAILAKGERSFSLVRHEVGIIVNKIRTARGKYGGEAVEQLAKALDYDASSLYRWADVANAWTTRAAIKGVLALPNSEGDPLTWCHFETLAKLGARKRGTFLERALSECLSVGKLREAIRQDGSERGAEQVSAGAGGTVTGAAGIMKLTAHLESVASEQAKWEEALAAIPEAGSPDLIKTLEHARDVQTRLRDTCTALLNRVEAVLSDRKRPRAVPLAPAPVTEKATAAL